MLPTPARIDWSSSRLLIATRAPARRREQQRAVDLERVDAEPREARVRLAVREPEHLAELARVAEVHLGPAVLELETQMRVRVGAEAQLLLGRERRARGGREQPRARAPAANSCPVMPRCSTSRAPSSSAASRYLPCRSSPHRGAARERAAQPRGRRDEEVARPRRAHAPDPAAHEVGRDPAARDLDFGELGHGISGSVAMRGRAHRAHRRPTGPHPITAAPRSADQRATYRPLLRGDHGEGRLAGADLLGRARSRRVHRLLPRRGRSADRLRRWSSTGSRCRRLEDRDSELGADRGARVHGRAHVRLVPRAAAPAPRRARRA